MNQRDADALLEFAGFQSLCRWALRATAALIATTAACALPTEANATRQAPSAAALLPIARTTESLGLPRVAPATIGLNTHGPDGEAALLASLRVAHTRLTYWLQRDSETERTLFAARLLDLTNHGVTPLIVLHDFGPDTVAQVASLAARFPTLQFQVLNEADAAGYTGTEYASLMARIKVAAPNAHLVGMGLACTDGQPWSVEPDSIRQPAFLSAYLNARGPILEAWSIHAYGWPLAERVAMLVHETRMVLQSRMPLYVTETGVDSAWMARAGVALAQMDSVQAAVTLAALTQNGPARIYPYLLWSPDSHGYGVLRPDRTRKPLATALATR